MSGTPEKPHDLRQQRHSAASTEPQSRDLFLVDPLAEKRSKAIDRALEQDAKVRERQFNVLPLGAFSMRDVVKQLKSCSNTGLTEAELMDYRYNIHQCVIACTKALVGVVKNSEIQLEEDVSDRYGFLCDFITLPHVDEALNEEAGHAIDALWKNPSVSAAFHSSAKYDLKDSSAYFFHAIRRIAAPDYIPTEADIVQSHKGIQGVCSHRILAHGSTINLIDVGTQRSERRKWMHHFDAITAILFVADLACYDQAPSGTNALAAQIGLFDSVINNKAFANTIFILFLSNVSVFRAKLRSSPLADHFPDFKGGEGGEDGELAGEYVLRRFSGVNRGGRKLYSYLVDPNVASNIELVVAAIKDSVH
ncbi:guanine nucleotide binding protein, alpha subunit [Boeremia exigua]|uniref:guanine nucleotide binding protein, alpha subunit n=1 Tax=Boeremia exigua TaxID=749465 RepID=UPI001E8EDF9E|nr:guanine nucleotide binding protein, alpha subunit [Boeremia exigua]KAH6644032.1 guanine nucleotide binding protein, alpha subunit [Boeremia exigua]